MHARRTALARGLLSISLPVLAGVLAVIAGSAASTRAAATEPPAAIAAGGSGQQLQLVASGARPQLAVASSRSPRLTVAGSQLQPFRHWLPPARVVLASYQVQSGDSLTSVAARLCGSAGDWTALWQGNQAVIGNLPGQIAAGETLRVTCSGTHAPATPVLAASGIRSAAAVPDSRRQGTPAASTTAGGGNWTAIAACESGGNWADDTGNSFYGGLQMSLSTWDAYGGTAYASRPDLASEAAQITVAVRIAVTGWDGTPPQGPGAWPHCWSGTVTAAVVHPAARPADPPRNDGGDLAARALAWAEQQAGVPYVYGGTGNGGYDCSGLVMAAYAHAGATLPRDTYEMLATAGTLLIPVTDPEPGDLAFFGSGHVELWVRPGETFGAQQPGTDVGFHPYGYGYAPTEFFRVA